MTTRIIPHLATGIVILVCLLLIAASASDLHCSMVRPGDATFVLACRASRLEVPR